MKEKKVMVSTTDNWCPNFEGDKVEVSKMQLLPETGEEYGQYRVCVWGEDDLGMEYDSTNRDEIETLFEYLTTNPEPITFGMLIHRGFVRS